MFDVTTYAPAPRLELRPYQSRCITAARTCIARAARSVCIVAPTGAGKTIIGVSIAAGALAKGNRVLWLAHRRELIEQTASSLRRAGVDQVSILRADDDRVDPQAQIVVASVQTLIARDDRPEAGVVVFDEAHHYAAAQWGAVAASYQNAVRVGLTATPERTDGSPLGDMFDDLVVAATYSELIEAGNLVSCTVIAPDNRLQGAIAMPPWEAWKKYGRGRPTVIFCATVAEAQECAAHIPDCGVIYGAMRDADRDQVIRDFAEGRIDTIANCNVLTEGWDAPRCEVCILARGCSHVSTYLQIVGRVLRPFLGKEWALLVDLSGCWHDHGFPTEDREYSLTGEAIARKSARDPIWQCKACGMVTNRPPADRTCARCGEQLPPPKRPKVRRSELSTRTWVCDSCKHERSTMPPSCPMCGTQTARGRRHANETDEQKAEFLAEKMKVGKLRGYKPIWAIIQFKLKYGHFPRKKKATAA